jgi:hypothetical protein
MAELVPIGLTNDWTSRVLKRLSAVRTTRRDELEAIRDTFGDPELLARHYVEPECQPSNPADVDEDEPVRAYRSPVRLWLDRFLAGEFRVHDGRNVLFVLADAGMGKTSLLLMLKLSHLMRFWPPEIDFKLLKLGQETLGELREVNCRSKTVLLLDALDEDPLAWGRIEERIEELLRKTHSFRQVIITCGTQFFTVGGPSPITKSGQVELGGFLCNLLYISPFSDRQVESYLRKVYPETFFGRLRKWLTGRDNRKLERAREVMLPMRSLRMRPMLLAYVEDLLKLEVDGWREYPVYRALVDEWLLREVRISGSRVTREELWQACQALALEMQLSGRRHLSPGELTELLKRQPAIQHLTAFELGGRSLLTRTSAGDYRFAHYSIQEFLAAHGLIDSISRGKAAGKTVPATDQLLTFLETGLQELPREKWESVVPWTSLSAAHHSSETLIFVQTPDEARFLQTVPWGHQLLHRLKEDEARLMRLRTPAPGCWLLQIRLPENLRELYGTASEILLLATAEEIRGEDLEKAREELRRREYDLDLDLLLVVDGHPRLEERLARIYQLWGQWVPWSPLDKAFAPLAEIFKPHLSPYDIFEAQDPVRGRQMIGRGAFITEVSRHLQRGKSLGIFGLRKVGKTTLVRAVTDKLDPVSRLPMLPKRFSRVDFGKVAVPIVWLDLQGLYPRTLETLAEQLTRSLEERLRLEGFDTIPRPSGEEWPLAALHQLLQHALQEERQPVCIVLDEYDLLFESDLGDPAIRGIDELFRMFRGHAQQTDRLTLVVIGRDSEFFDRPEMNGRPNPMLNWFVPRWLGPMDPPDADELLRRLGRRAGLEIGGKTADLARWWSGGHPLLHRQFGSALLELARRRQGSRGHVPTDPFCENAVDSFLDRDAVLNICREVHLLLAKRYPEASAWLHELSQATLEELSAALVTTRIQPAVRTLQRFGLLLDDTGTPRIPELFRWYQRSFLPANNRIAV